MAEREEDAPEGWHVPQRLPVLVAVAVPLTLLALLLVAGWAYDRRLRPARVSPVHAFPAPGIETYIHGGVKEPRLRAVPPARDPAVTRAMDTVAARGLPGWSRP